MLKKVTRYNIWRYNTGAGFTIKQTKEAAFPAQLAEDHIKSWTMKGM